jgi:hypothetical protein
MNERVSAKNKTSTTPPQATQASSPLLHQSSLTDELSESIGSNSNISKELGGIQPKTIRRSLNWQNISVEAPSRGNGRSLPGGIQRQQEEAGTVIGDRVSGDSVQKSALELSNSTISTSEPAQKPLIARSPFNGRNISIEAPARSSASSTSPGGIQRLETSGVKEQQVSTESLQRQSEGAIQAKSSEGETREKEGQNKESVQTKLTVGAPGDKYEQEADSMAAKVMRMPDPTIQQPIQRQAGKGTAAVQMQPLVNSITPLVQRSSGKEEEVQRKSEVQRASDGSSVASGSVENRLAGSKGGGSALPKDVRSFMEPRFGADFSNIKVHTDSNAVQMNKELGAQAFAHGSDIYYGTGKSPGKNELTAHELTHTIQQGAAVRMNKEVRRSPNQQFEEKEQLQAKKLPDHTLKDSLNKELRLQPFQEQEETKPLQAKELPGHNSEVSLNKELRRQPEETPDGVIQAKTLESGFTPSPLSIQRGIGDKRKAVTGIKQKIRGIKQGVDGFLKDKGNRLKEKLRIKKPPEAGKEGAQRDPKEATNKAGNSFGGEINSDLGRGVDAPTGSRPDVDLPSAKQPEVKQSETAVKPPQTEANTPETEVKAPETQVKPPQTEVKTPEMDVKSPQMGVKAPETEVKVPENQVKPPETEVKVPEAQVKAPETDTPEQVLNVEQVLNAVKSRIASQSDKFDLTYTKDELESIIKNGKKLGLSDKVVEDLIYTGSRKAKAIKAKELIDQMEHWVNVINQRGFPEKFANKKEFEQFSQDLLAGVRETGIPADNIRIQGSSLRKPDAQDVDIAAFVDERSFDNLLIKRFDERITIRESSEKVSKVSKVSLEGKSHNDLVKLANDIAANPRKYNSQGATFQNALLNGIISSKSDIIKSLKTVRQGISAKYPHLNVEAISVLIKGGRFDVKPDLPVTGVKGD